MADCRDKWAPQPLPGEASTKGRGKITVKRLFEAGLSLDQDELEFVLSSGTVDVNEHYFIDRSSSAEPDDHTKQTFGPRQIKGKIICNLFAKLDDGSFVKSMFIILQVDLLL